MSSVVLLDTDVLSALMRRDRRVSPAARAYLRQQARLTFSIITRYEILRGLKAKDAGAQLTAFDRLCAVSEVLPLTDPIVVRAADIYASLHQRGALISDADILIAATAMEHGVPVASINRAHFSRIAGLTLVHWIEPT